MLAAPARFSELAAVVAAAEPKEGVADPKGLEVAEAVVAKTEEPMGVYIHDSFTCVTIFRLPTYPRFLL